MSEYKIGKIYQIFLLTNPDIRYIGSTFNRLSDRFRQHKNNKDTSISKYFKEFGIENFKIILIKEYECVDRRHLETKESLWISKLENINITNPFGNPLKKHLDKLRDRTYYKINQSVKNKNNKIICECGKEFRKDGLKDHLNTKIHKDFISQSELNTIQEYKKLWYQKNKEKILLKAKLKYHKK